MTSSIDAMSDSKPTDEYTVDAFDADSLTLVFVVCILFCLCVLLRKCEKIMALDDDDMPVAVARPYPGFIQCPHCDEIVELLNVIDFDSDSDSGSDII
jgi:hypothetical protein